MKIPSEVLYHLMQGGEFDVQGYLSDRVLTCTINDKHYVLKYEDVMLEILNFTNYHNSKNYDLTVDDADGHHEH